MLAEPGAWRPAGRARGHGRIRGPAARVAARRGRTTRQADPQLRWPARQVHYLAARPADHAVAGDPIMTVWFVGAGPGAPDLQTVRAQRLLAEAAVVLYAGSLVPAEILADTRSDARLVDTAGLDLDAIIGELVSAHASG